MLKWVIKKNSIRLYDVLSIIIFSSSVNVIIWGFTVTNTIFFIFYPLLLLSFGSLFYAGWSFYWLYKEVTYSIEDAAGIEETAVRNIRKKNQSFKFTRHFALGIICSIGGMIFFIVSVRLPLCP